MKAIINIQRCPKNITGKYILARPYIGVLWYHDDCNDMETAKIAIEEYPNLVIVSNPEQEP